MLDFRLVDVLVIATAGTGIAIPIGSGRRDRSDRAGADLLDTVLACAAGDTAGGVFFSQRLCPADGSDDRAPGRRFDVQHAASGTGAQSSRRTAPGAAAAAASIEKGRKAAAAESVRRAEIGRAPAGIHVRADRAVDRRARTRGASAGQCLPASAADLGISLPTAATNAINRLGDDGFAKILWTVRALCGTFG
jgi:hypothetical protein